MKNKKSEVLLLIFLMIIVIALGGFLGYKYLNNRYDKYHK